MGCMRAGYLLFTVPDFATHIEQYIDSIKIMGFLKNQNTLLTIGSLYKLIKKA